MKLFKILFQDVNGVLIAARWIIQSENAEMALAKAKSYNTTDEECLIHSDRCPYNAPFLHSAEEIKFNENGIGWIT